MAAEAAKPPETPDQTIARLQAENDELRRAESSEDAHATAATEGAATPVAPVEALQKAIAANPEGSIGEHLEVLAHDGIGAILNPAVEGDVFRVIAALVHDIAKGVKL